MAYHKENVPPLKADDVYHLLFGLSDVPLVMPWHDGIRAVNNDDTWVKRLDRLEDKQATPAIRGKGKPPCNLAVRIDDVLEGLPWLEKSKNNATYGFKLGEKQFLLGYLEDELQREARQQTPNLSYKGLRDLLIQSFEQFCTYPAAMSIFGHLIRERLDVLTKERQRG